MWTSRMPAELGWPSGKKAADATSCHSMGAAYCGLTCVPPKTCPCPEPPEPVNMALLGNEVIAGIISQDEVILD